MSISKTLRFEIFKRDLFTCRYCGQNPPAVILEIDHVIPVSDNGDDAKENLITACFDCNRGKGARSLGQVIKPLEDSAAEIEERERQIKAYKKLLRDKKRREEEEVSEVEKSFKEVYQEFEFTRQFRTQVRKTFLTRLTLEEAIEAMEVACARGLPHDRVIKYFCGVAWNMIRSKEKNHAN